MGVCSLSVGPNHSRSDGKAEAAVKIAKRLLKRSQDTSHTRVAALDLGKGLGEDIQEHQHSHGKILPPLQVSEPVLVKDVKAKKAQQNQSPVQIRYGSGWSYVFNVEGNVLHRNREFMKPSKNRPADRTEPRG